MAAMQLNWHPDAFVLSADGLVDILPASPVDILTQRGVQWLHCMRARDMAVYSGEVLMDLSFLSQAIWLREMRKAAVVTQV
jgi:hypothetical protein